MYSVCVTVQWHTWLLYCTNEKNVYAVQKEKRIKTKKNNVANITLWTTTLKKSRAMRNVVWEMVFRCCFFHNLHDLILTFIFVALEDGLRSIYLFVYNFSAENYIHRRWQFILQKFAFGLNNKSDKPSNNLHIFNN